MGTRGLGGLSDGLNELRSAYVQFDPSLKPKSYQIKETPSSSKILFRDVNILDSTGGDPYRGDVFIEGERIRYVGTVPEQSTLSSDPKVRVIDGQGRTLMSGQGDAHTHFTWNEGDLAKLGELGVEEHTLVTLRSVKKYLDSGYTMCFGAASAKDRLDCVIRDAINNGDIPGPRYLANGKEIAVPDGDLVPGITAFAKGPLETRETIRHHIKIGVDTIKLSMSGEEICETRRAQDCYFSDEETAACVDEAHRQGIRLCAHARARDSVKMCVKHGVDIIYHASWSDEEGLKMLERNKHKHVVAPGINWLIATLYEADQFGYPNSKAEQVGYKKELEVAIQGLREMHRRGITVLPGGDYGFAWTPHDTYARDLEHLVKLLDFTPMESILAATAGVAKLFMREDELGKVAPGFRGFNLDHDKLDVIIINGRVHKISPTEYLKPEPSIAVQKTMDTPLTNYLTYVVNDGNERTRVGHFDSEKKSITPLSYASGTPLSNLYEVIEIGADGIIAADEDSVPLDSVKVLPPLTKRDVLAIGKNYSDHAKEFNASGYDASDKVDIPTHSVVFTKRATSIIADGEEILPLPEFTSTLDYEGEIGVILGKAGHNISEAEASNHVWGFTIINDVTAREKQRDHKQFYIGKSGDSYCPMGPIAVPVQDLPKVLKVQTRVNGELRQEGTSENFIFSVNYLIKTLSESQTLQPGDIIATGTPAGVGFGLKPPQFLKPGDLVEISISGLGTLRNRIAETSSSNHVQSRLSKITTVPTHNLSITNGGQGLTRLSNDKLLYIQTLGPETGRPIVFIHGLGGTSTYYLPLINALEMQSSNRCILYDLEGHGLSPTKASSIVSIQSYTDDLSAIFQSPELKLEDGATIVAHSMGCLVAQKFAVQHPELVTSLMLIGPPPNPLPAGGVAGSYARAKAVRSGGMRAVADMVAKAGTSARTKSKNPLAYAAVLQSLLSQDLEGYSKGCTALAGSGAEEQKIDVKKIVCETLVVTGDEDKVSSVSWCEGLVKEMKDARLEILAGVGHWHGYEDVDGLGRGLKAFL
ncbi:putative fumarylacetoacetate hydrolase [Clohesyomyces aquaticus]|uniref:Putative fumarylacetoacetate hydrolase n=1 Tax=Clohesyomyces aquaticus TaxID=1231657 RepID=A0A1Y1ZGC7_9PLEO|nr:putative fumarylacetoacetate hydrolase [Clohesyomyces aquaticus]